MCAEILLSCGSDPTVLSGAELPSMGGAYCVGESDNFVFEACEYMDSFLDFNPTIAVVLNIEMDHVDYFKSMEHIRSSFGKYASLTGADGYAVYNADDTDVVSALENYGGNRISFGIESRDAYVRAVNITNYRGRYAFDVVMSGDTVTHVQLMVSGYYNIYNALAAFAACSLCGISSDDIARGLGGFCGACRRMEYKGTLGGADVYEDYGHHPTEISATLSGAKPLAQGRLFCVYQPHTYSRTAALLNEFAEAFGEADRVIFVDIYAAREKNTYGVSSQLLAERVGEKAGYADSFEAAARQLCSELCDGDVAIIMGAGDVYKVFDYIEFDE
jgi:UDP-N-acetylmuramate--alanine ligase